MTLHTVLQVTLYGPAVEKKGTVIQFANGKYLTVNEDFGAIDSKCSLAAAAVRRPASYRTRSGSTS